MDDVEIRIWCGEEMWVAVGWGRKGEWNLSNNLRMVEYGSAPGGIPIHSGCIGWEWDT